nr:probable DNA-directed RNA polymerase III subunit RPC6 [Leptinotarsa decemlineata]
MNKIKIEASEHGNQNEAESQLLDLAKSQAQGISDEDIKAHIPDIPITELVAIINKCLSKGTLELFKKNGKPYYKYKNPSKKSTPKGTDNEEKVVYKIIEEAGNIGIWIRAIRVASNLNAIQLNKVVKSLEMKKLIKAVKSVSESKKKVYMLYDLEPDRSVTGGSWYQGHDFESEFVDVLNQQCHRFLVEKWEEAKKFGGGPLLIKNRSYATASDVHKFISELGISKVSLTVDDIESILYTVVLDNNAERIVATNGSYLYKAVNRFISATGLVQASCGICPLANRCADTGLVNPKACTYFTDWLNQ